MTGGFGVSKRLKLSLVFLPVIVLACLFRPAGFVSAYFPLLAIYAAPAAVASTSS